MDTAGWQQLAPNNDQLANETIDQTRKALIYSDLALLLVDGRKGIDEYDISLCDWIQTKLEMGKLKNRAILKNQTIEERLQIEKDEIEKIMLENRGKTNKEAIISKKKELDFLNSFKSDDFNDVTIPKILLVCNKCENGHSPDIDELYKLHIPDGPIMISAEHGDNVRELLDAIQAQIPIQYPMHMDQLIKHRITAHQEIKEKLLSDIKEQYKEINEEEITSWKKEFDKYNPKPQENSEYDDEDIWLRIVSPELHKGKISTKNYKLGRPTQISIVGKPNVGKSSIVNALLKENRVVVSDIPGTTRDSIHIQWLYKVGTLSGKTHNLS